jgi:NADH:ubiquinone oxidoreductase subunit
MGILKLLNQLLTWWNGQTFGTWVYTMRVGQEVGRDEQGNRFYRTDDGKRRWVVYNGVAEASKISPDWHGWLHHTFDDIPSQAPLPRKAWEKDHQPNPTGTDAAYHPPGSVVTPARRPRVAGDYEAWRPE